jgi:hypothetical protein
MHLKQLVTTVIFGDAAGISASQHKKTGHKAGFLTTETVFFR